MGRKKIDMDEAQRRRMFAMAKQLGLDVDDLRDMAHQYTQQRSISSLSRRQANDLNAKLQVRCKLAAAGEKTEKPMVGKICVLYKELGWNTHEFRAWLKKFHHVDHEDFLPAAAQTKVIEGLKAMIARKQREAANG